MEVYIESKCTIKFCPCNNIKDNPGSLLRHSITVTIAHHTFHGSFSTVTSRLFKSGPTESLRRSADTGADKDFPFQK